MSARAVKSFSRGHVKLITDGKSGGWKGPDVAARITQDLSLEETRTLLAAIASETKP